MRYKIIIAYDGTDYHGWQEQEGHTTIAGTLQKTFHDVFNHEIFIRGASRTDAGVHALGQVAVFDTPLVLDPTAMKIAWSNSLPSSLLIRDIQHVADEYSPFADVAEKTYYYHFFQERPLPMVARYGFYYRYPVDIQKLHDCVQVFVGTHDFRSFCTGYDRPDTVRTITSASIEYLHRFKMYRISIKGPGFLRYMIRRIVGACLEVASRDTVAVNALRSALAEKNPHQLFPTAPAQGLLLYKIRYHQKVNL